MVLVTLALEKHVEVRETHLADLMSLVALNAGVGSYHMLLWGSTTCDNHYLELFNKFLLLSLTLFDFVQVYWLRQRNKSLS